MTPRSERATGLAPVAAVLVALLGCKQLKELGSDQSAPAPVASPVVAPPVAPSASAARKPPEPPPGEVVDITEDAIISLDTTSEKEKHPAKNLFDKNPKTAWVEDSPSDGEGHYVEARLVPGTYLSHVMVSAGWGAETRFKEDLWELNNSARVLKVSWDGGEAEVTFQRSKDRGVKKRVDVGAKTNKVRITAEAIAKGKFNDLAIDGHELFGVLGR